MKRFLAVLCLLAIVLFVANGPQARANGLATFIPDNFFNCFGAYPQIPYDYPGTFYSTLPTGPTATEDGLVWLNTGSGPLALYNNAHLAYSVYYENSNSAWELVANMASLQGYSGYFAGPGNPDNDGAEWTVNDAEYVGSETVPAGGVGNYKTFEQGLFYVQFWTDPQLESTGTSAYSTYSAALSASSHGTSGVYVAQTVPFLVDIVTAGGLGSLTYPQNRIGMYMPAVVLAEGVATPEPSTIVLMLAGLLGLLAYAWRRRK